MGRSEIDDDIDRAEDEGMGLLDPEWVAKVSREE